MLILLGLLLFVLGVSFVLFFPALWRHEIYKQYSGSRAVICPETHQQVGVSIDARHAAASGMSGHPDLRLAECTRWPERARCDQACLPDALRAEPYTAGEVRIGRKKIYHLPVLIAAFSAWYLGALWHSAYLFRARWAEAAGMTPGQYRQLVWWYAPHVLSVAVCILFAYGVAWLIALRGRKGVSQGIRMSFLLWGTVALACSAGIAKLSHELLMIEVSYTILAATVVGAIIGGLDDKLTLPVSAAHR